MPTPLINVLVVDDHPAVRAGLRALIDAQDDMRAVGEASDGFTLAPAIRRLDPALILLDYQMPGTNGLELCRRIKARTPAPRVVIYSSFVAATMAIPARIAGADALVDKGVPPRELAATIRAVMQGEAIAGEVTPEAMNLAGELLAPDDLPLLGMLVNGVSAAEVAETLRLDTAHLESRIDRMLEILA